MTVKFGVLAEMNDVLDKTFSFIITWMRFPRKDELDGILFVLHQPDNLFKLLENERSTFVSCKASCKSNR